MKSEVLVGVTVASCLVACGQSSEAPPTVERSQSTAEQLQSLQGCASQAQSCWGDAAGVASIGTCEQKLRLCLEGSMGDGGPPALPDASLPRLPTRASCGSPMGGCAAAGCECAAAERRSPSPRVPRW